MNPNIFRGKYVLVVDDVEELTELMCSELKSEGFEQVLVAHDGEECISLLREFGEKIFVMTLDLKMSGMSGFEVMRYLAGTHTQIMAVIMVTATTDLKIAEKFLSLGTANILAFDYFTKPFEFEELIPRMKEAVARVEGKRQMSIHYPSTITHAGNEI
jgi:DNA-binding response OmpR family regulator